MTDDAEIEIVHTLPSFSWVPDSILTEGGLSLQARAVLAWLVGRPRGWRVQIWHLRRELGEKNGSGKKVALSPSRWRKIRNELEANGYFRQSRARNEETGRWVWRHQVFDTPQPSIPQPSIGTKSTDGGSTDGGSTDGRSIDGQSAHITKESLTIKKAPRKAAEGGGTGAQPRGRAGGSAAAPRAGNLKKRRVRASGLVTWDSEDEETAARIEAAADPEQIAAAVGGISAIGKEPLPGLVAKYIEKESARIRADAARVAMRKVVNQLPPDPAAVAAGQALLPATLRARAGLPAHNAQPRERQDRG